MSPLTAAQVPDSGRIRPKNGPAPRMPQPSALSRLVESGLADEAIGAELGVSGRTVRFWRTTLAIKRKRVGRGFGVRPPPPPIAFKVGMWPPSLETLMAVVRTDRSDREIGLLYDRPASAVRDLRIHHLDRAAGDPDVVFCLRRMFRKSADRLATTRSIRALSKSRQREAELYGGLRYADVGPSLLARESFLPGWWWEPRTRNLAERHDPQAVRPKAACTPAPRRQA